MYFSTFSSSEYYSDEDTNDTNINDENDTCIICWLPSNEKNVIKTLTDFTTITTTCNCNPKLHILCLDDWIQKSSSCPSCPICRKTIHIHLQHITNNSVKTFTCIIVFINFTTGLLRTATLISIINLFTICVYNCYLMYNIRQEYFDDYY